MSEKFDFERVDKLRWSLNSLIGRWGVVPVWI